MLATFSLLTDIPSQIFGSVNMIIGSMVLRYQAHVQRWSARECTGNLALPLPCSICIQEASEAKPSASPATAATVHMAFLTHCPGIKETRFYTH